MLFYSGWQENILEDLLSYLPPISHQTKVNVQAVSAIRRQKRTDLKGSPSSFKLSVSFSVLTKERSYMLD